MADYETFLKAVEDVKRVFFIDSVKQQQLEGLYNFVCKRDVFINLPTGFGKSLIYQMTPLVVKQLGICDNPIILIVSPLVALMQDQVNQLRKQGVSAISLSESGCNDEKLKSGDYTFVYSSPESLLSNEVMRELIGSHIYKQRVFGIVVDEAHCISHWGYGCHGQIGRHAFRKWFSHIQEIRSLVPSNAPVMALTATAVKKTRDVILKTLGMKNPVIVASSPNRKNISYSVKLLDKNMALISYFQWLVDAVKENKTQTERVIIYCQTIRQCHKLYSMLVDNLGNSNQANPLNDKQKLVEMLHSNTPGRVKDEIIQSMSNSDGYLRVLVCTIAFGMGIDCKDVKTVIHLGPSRNIESYVQESGRCGRQGGQSNAIIYYVGRMLTHVDKQMKEYVNLHADDKTCRRECLLSHFSLSRDEMNLALRYEINHNCCDLCANNCSCGADDCPANVMPSPEVVQSLSQRREISSEQKQELTKKLIILRKEINIPIFEQFVGYGGQVYTPEAPLFFNQFSTFQINQVLNAANCLFSLDDVIHHVEIWKRGHAIKVYRILAEVFNDVEPIPDDFLTGHEANSEDSDEQEWDDFMNDSLQNFSVSNLDMSSFDFGMESMVEDDDIYPTSVESALQRL